jgi:hypothetical protein
MFHITEKIYLEYDYSINQKRPYMVASSQWGTRPMVTINDVAAPQHADSFTTLINNQYAGDRENFWRDIISREGNFVVFLDADTLTALQIQYWASIFSDSLTVADMHKLHTSWVESRHLESRVNRIGSWDNTTQTWSRPNAYTDLKFLTIAEIQTLIDENPASAVLMAMDKNKVSFEYLLADYSVDAASPYKTELMQRIKFLTWDNWLDELEHLKYEILSGAVDAGKLDPSLSITLGNIESELARSNLLKWTIDPSFGTNVDYIRSTYDPAVFMACYTKLAEVWKHQYDDMVELSNLINADQYEQLLERDVARNYGCSYTRTRFLSKSNQVFATYCYIKLRENATNDLAPFMLRR